MGRVLSKVVAYSIEAACLAAVIAAIVIGCRSSGSSRIHRDLYPSGAVEREYGVDAAGKRHGSYFEYFEDGSIRQEAEFSHGIWSRFTHYHANGQKMMESVAGSPSRYWDEDGTENVLR